MTKFDRYQFHHTSAGLVGGKLTLVTNGSTTDQGSSYSKRYSHAQNQTRSSILRRNFRTGQPKLAALQRHARLQHAKGNSRTIQKTMLTTDIQLRKLVRSLWRMGGRAFFQTKLPQWICRRGAVGLPVICASRSPEWSFRRTYFWGPQVPSLQDIANLQFHHKQPARPKKKSRSWASCLGLAL